MDEENEVVLEDVLEKNIQLTDELKQYNKSLLWLRFMTIFIAVLTCIMTIKIMGWM